MTRKRSDFIFPGVLSRLKILCLETEKRDAKKKYSDSQKMYVNTMLGRPMEKLNVRKADSPDMQYHPSKYQLWRVQTARRLLHLVLLLSTVAVVIAL